MSISKLFNTIEKFLNQTEQEKKKRFKKKFKTPGEYIKLKEEILKQEKEKIEQEIEKKYQNNKIDNETIVDLKVKTENNKKRMSKEEYKKSLVKKGKDYEKYVGKYFENLGYIVKFNGIEKGKKDSSIDLIAIRNDEIVLIQCKNWKENSKYKINHEKIKSFVGDTYSFIEKNPIYKNYKIQRIFAISNRILDKSAIAYIKENRNIVNYMLLHMPD
ncbi:restriction endonuclease [Hydrogenimonas thermophila]|uniref:Restriction system protein n=1 Tax=Hydrogenimonas thermophila TaxID=223786 RepID=A0A1I5QJK7_9BACT|nr:restriction endonuclease [Hydrogenimonas thermophila]SFP46230.1 restriction system protein [Hydrogenimonas thermophila]